MPITGSKVDLSTREVGAGVKTELQSQGRSEKPRRWGEDGCGQDDAGPVAQPACFKRRAGWGPSDVGRPPSIPALPCPASARVVCVFCPIVSLLATRAGNDAWRMHPSALIGSP
ncbi:hypothetical protein VTN96DRAFT_8723 [Rasamsonia emersonii]